MRRTIGLYLIAAAALLGQNATTLKQQLGLQLVEDRRIVELLVIDHIEKPQFSK